VFIWAWMVSKLPLNEINDATGLKV
jgi:hypothetical protein